MANNYIGHGYVGHNHGGHKDLVAVKLLGELGLHAHRLGLRLVHVGGHAMES